MIHNLDTVDSLTNGQLGTFIDAIKSKDGKVEKLVLRLDKAGAGKFNQRQNPELVKRFPEHVLLKEFLYNILQARKIQILLKQLLFNFQLD